MSNPRTGAAGGPRVVDATSQRDLGQIAFVASVNVADPVGLTDTNLSLLSIDSAGRCRVLATPAAGATFPVVPAILANSVGTTARVVAPAAGGAIATIAAGSLPAGTYDVQVRVLFDAGAPAAADLNNFEFRRGATVVSSIQAITVINVYSTVVVFRCVLDGATAVSVNATGAGTAGVGYNAELLATRIA